jgi:hypothetical protein
MTLSFCFSAARLGGLMFVDNVQSRAAEKQKENGWVWSPMNRQPLRGLPVYRRNLEFRDLHDIWFTA